jgi:hypothetical protein
MLCLTYINDMGTEDVQSQEAETCRHARTDCHGEMRSVCLFDE